MSKSILLSKKFSSYTMLYGTFAVYSLSSICSKFAASYVFLSLEFCLLYATVILLLFIYAILWQQVLKRFSLTFAYANKAVVIPLGMLWGYLFFDEPITPTMILGIAIIFIGVVLIAGDKDE